jgi:AbrB family looped-hinge helix DNA binding protein
MPYAKLSSKSQIVIPADIRRKLRVRPGDTLEMTLKDDTVTIRKAPVSYLEALENCASDLWRGSEKELQKERDQWES